MKRKVLIIINPGEDPKADNYCRGVYVDRDNYIRYFRSPGGGYYGDHEIEVLERPSVFLLNVTLVLLESYEFSIVIFCGHGFYSSKSSSNILELKEGHTFDSLRFKDNVAKRIIILDSCRQVHDEYLNESEIKKAMFSAEALGREQVLDGEKCRRYYNKRITECDDQIISCFAADVDELANDSDSFGGYYSSNLLKSADKIIATKLKTVNLTTHYHISSVFGPHTNASQEVKTLSGGKQNPVIEKPRLSGNLLPFLVVA
ncbi:MAG: hypothetical protein EOP48_03170 [Sphingobacteriales bacterium]|nr:MAG: hypothetical protein EOP48_03170 [Sphingobacteriales bacterium]